MQGKKGDKHYERVVTPEMFVKAKMKQLQLRKRLYKSLIEYAKPKVSIRYLNPREKT